MALIDWVVCLLLALSLPIAHPQCLQCSPKCYDITNITESVITSPTLSVLCNASTTSLNNYFQMGNFSLVNSLSIRSPNIKDLNLTFTNVLTQLDISSNRLEEFFVPTFPTLTILNLSHNKLQSFNVNFSQLLTLDLSHNLIENIYEVNFRLKKLEVLNFSCNLLFTVSNFSSSTLVNLDISNNVLENIHFGKCEELKFLNLSNNNISLIEVDAFKGLPKLEVLNLSMNAIEEIREETFKTPNLLKLDLKRNYIGKLIQGCFAGLNRLQYLDISENKITFLSPGMMQDLPGLVRLTVSGNKDLNKGLQDLGLVLVTRRLQHVDAAATKQTKIPSSLTRSVRSLDLTSNNISSIQCGDLDSYPLLTSLTLSHNNISYIEDDALGRLELLSYLNLDCNSLPSIPHTLPGNLVTLSLRDNSIRQLGPNEFIGLSQLTTLDLSNNLITNVSDNFFSQLKSLQLLNISNNPIKILLTGCFVGLTHLKVLDLSFLFEVAPCEEVLCFPLPESNQLQQLRLKQSTMLANRLLNDMAALKALKQLTNLDLSESNITFVREDLITLLPRLNVLNLDGNEINCTCIQWLHNWLGTSKIANCFSSVERTIEAVETTTQVSSEKIHEAAVTTPAKTEAIIIHSTLFVTNSQALTTEDVTEIATEYEILTNEIWDNSSSLGIVYAFSSEIPTSHPGLFILLLVPVALVSAVLVINYSRLIQARRRENVRFDSEMEIPDFSNELW